jgi:hypothetical protein
MDSCIASRAFATELHFDWFCVTHTISAPVTIAAAGVKLELQERERKSLKSVDHKENCTFGRGLATWANELS